MRLFARLATAALLAVPPIAAGPASAVAPEPPAPLLTAADPVPGRYIVTLEEGRDAAKVARELGLKPSFVYTSAMTGFAVPLTADELAVVRGSSGVKSVEEDASVKVPMPVEAGEARAPSNSWGQDRIDQRHLPLDHDFTTVGDGAGVTAYIFDSGIDYAHEEFGGRATFGFDAIGDGRQGQDCSGHGTHVAGTVGGATFGVARKVNLVSVRVLGCDGSGSWSGVLAGMDWVAKNAHQPAVLNGSLGGDRSATVNNAATALAEAGVLPVFAAGNSSVDACTFSPASAEGAVAVAASDQSDEQTGFSDHGPCVSLYAPGQAIVSAKLGGGSVALNGTSMAAPHVTGVAALYKQAHPSATPAEVAAWLVDESTKDVLTGVGEGSPNRLLFTGGL
ncbi:S8 family peptidase [Streptomyces sp. NPDC059835]|uniref:S8 family peptidase n=1 Tax=Streptomyces sp. NPDC059835 TaxID=3346967 RepID=UPI003650A91F